MELGNNLKGVGWTSAVQGRKLFWVVFLMVGVITARAQTNWITFTNKDGRVITNAEVVKVDAANLIYRDGSMMGRVKLKDLPESLRARFNYDESKARAAEQKERDRSLSSYFDAVRQDEDNQWKEATRQRRAKVAKTGTLIYARVIQVLKEGLLIDASGEGAGSGWKGYVATPEYKTLMKGNSQVYHRMPVASGIILLVNYPKARTVVDGDGFETIGYPVGTYKYVSVGGGEKTIRKYTWDIDSVGFVLSGWE